MKTHIVQLPALVLSAAIHSGLWLAAGGAGNGTVIAPDAAAASVMTVELRSSENLPASSVSRLDNHPLSASKMENMPSPPRPAGAEPVLPITAAPEPYYFRTSQLTQKPIVLHDASSDLILVLPELPDQVAILRLFVSDQGSIDKVVLEESQLPEAAERRVVDAFSKITFKPGKIGRIAVRSQLRIEVRTADFSFPREKLSQRTDDSSRAMH